MAADRKIVFTFEGDTRDLESALRTITRSSKSTEKAAKDIGGGFSDMAKEAKDAGKAGTSALDRMKKRSAPLAKAIGAVTLTIAAVTVAFAAAAKGANAAAGAVIDFAEAGDEIAKTAKKIGSSVEDIQLVRFALSEGGIAATEADAAIAKLNIRLAEAAADTGPAVDALRDLNLEAEDLQAMPLPERLATIADAIDNMSTHGEKSVAVVALMEEGGQHLLSAFEGGGDEIRKSAGALKEIGVVSGATARESEKLIDSVGRTKSHFSALKAEVLAPMVPVLTGVTRGLSAMMGQFRGSGKAAELGKSLQIFASERLILGIAGVAISIDAMVISISKLFKLEWGSIIEDLEMSQARINAGANAIIDTIDEAVAEAEADRTLSVTMVMVGTEAWDEMIAAREEAERERKLISGETAAEEKSAAESARDLRKQQLADIKAYLRDVRASFEDSWANHLVGVEGVDFAEQLALKRAEERGRELIDAAATSAEERLKIEEMLEHDKERIRLEYADRRKAALKAEAEEAESQAKESLDKTIQMANDIAGTFADVAGSISSAFDDVTSKLVGIASESRQKVEQLSADLRSATTEQERERLGAELATASRALREQRAAAMEAFGVGKAAAISQASIAGALAVVNALATPGAPFPVAVGFSIAAGIAAAAQIGAIASEPPPTFHAGGMVGLGAPDEISARLLRSEAVLSPQGVRAAGGAGGVRDLNRGGTAGQQPVITVFKVRSRAVDAMVSDNLRTKQGPLVDALRAAQPRALGRHNPYSSG